MQKTDHWKDQVSYYRFFRNENVTEGGLIDICTNHCKEQSFSSKHLLLIEDTTELNFEHHRSRITDFENLGTVGNNSDLGFFCHPTIAVDAEDGALLGALDIHLWHRPIGKKDKNERQYNKLPIEEKESYRWPDSGISASKRLANGQQVTILQDREGDIYENLCLLKEAGLNFVVRSHHNRKIADSDLRVREHIGNLSPSYEYVLDVRGESKKRQRRQAIMEMCYEQITLLQPENSVESEKYPSRLEVYVVHVKERQESVPKGEKPIEWTLYTTHVVRKPEEALQIAKYYAMRWIIEDLFRAVKSEGVNFENSELESGKALRKLFVMAFMAAIQILQLRQARSGETNQELSLVFSAEQIECMDDLMPRFEGKTEKLKNPFAKNNLAWGAWLIARMGGWKGFASQRPPGVIILHDGWLRFQNLFEGWCIAKNCV